MHTVSNAPLAPLTTLELGGVARCLVDIESRNDFTEFIAEARRTDAGAPIVIGSGSNIVVADEGYDGTIAHMRVEGLEFRPHDDGEQTLAIVQAGHSLQAFVDEAVERRLVGIEMLTGIPGTVGATAIQNVGAYGQEVAETIAEVHAYDWHLHRYVTLSGAACRFGHRTSIFKHSHRWTILSVSFVLAPSQMSCPLTYRAVADAAGVTRGRSAPLRDAVAAVRDVRSQKGMILDRGDPDHRSVGSVFLSPVIDTDMAKRLRRDGAPVNAFPDGNTRVSASWLIREAGFSLGEPLADGIRMSSKHFTLVADGDATTASFADASVLVAEKVAAQTGVRLTAEPDLIGSLPRYAALTKS